MAFSTAALRFDPPSLMRPLVPSAVYFPVTSSFAVLDCLGRPAHSGGDHWAPHVHRLQEHAAQGLGPYGRHNDHVGCPVELEEVRLGQDAEDI